MKKLILVIILLVTAAALAACGNDDTTDRNYDNGNNQTQADAQPTAPPIVVHQQAILTPTPQPTPATPEERLTTFASLDRNIFVEDLDYFITQMQLQFLHFDVVYRRFGVDFNQTAEELRVILLDEDFEITFAIFTQLLRDHFFMHPDIPYSVANWHFNWHSQRSDGFDGEGPHAEVDVIEDGRIGYIRINCFELHGFGIAGGTTRMVRNFITDNADFEHIIIDIRGVDGGLLGVPNAWENAIIAPNISHEFTQTFHALERGGGICTLALYSRMTAHAAIPGAQFGLDGRVPRGGIRRIEDIGELPYLDPAVAAVVNMGLTYSRTITPPVDATPFGGQLWLLIDERTGTAAAQFASLAKYTDVAILVGVAAGGDMAMTHDSHIRFPRALGATQFTLPSSRVDVGFNSGFHVDEFGRSLDEYTVQPHIFNRDGMDALETVLVMIAEMTEITSYELQVTN